MTLTYRATAEDAAECAHLLDAFNAEYGEDSPGADELTLKLRRMLGSDTECVLIGRPSVGIAVMRFREAIWFPGQECYLAEFYLKPEHRGNGLGTQLLAAAIDIATQRGAQYMDLCTAETDVAARHVYEKLGFSRSEGVPNGPINYYYERTL